MPPEPSHLLGAHLPAHDLANLSLSRECGVRRAVASHPNTSPQILGTLATEFPGEVLDNSALPLLRLAQPGLLLRWPVAALAALVGQQEAPAWLLRQALTCPAVEVQAILARHPQLPPSEISRLARHPAWLVRARVAARPDLPVTLLRALAHDPDDSVRLAVACRAGPGTPERDVLTSDPSRYVQQVLRRSHGPTVDT